MRCLMNGVECEYATVNGFCCLSACNNINLLGNVVPKEQPQSLNVRPQKASSNWHTGTPTEEGWYLIAFLGSNKRIEYASAVWCYNEWDAHCRVIAWQKITPYEEKQNGHID